MRILHYYDKADEMISQHVKMLTDNMGLEAESYAASEPEQARTLLKGGHLDILHLHGCWRSSSRSIVKTALKQGARLVVTPHGQLEPWVREENRWKEKLPKRLLFQQTIIQRAYAVLIQGSMEQECMQQLGWNTRTVVIRNAVITSSTTPAEMARKTFTVYRKILDSNPLQLMMDDTKRLLYDLLTVGTAGDKRWLSATSYLASTSPLTTSQETPHTKVSSDQWRLLLCYAHQEQITDILYKGIRILGLDAPDIDASQIDFYVPDGFQYAESIKDTIGFEFVSENDRLMATFRYLHRVYAANRLAVKHLAELNRELREHGCNEETLDDDLKERRLWKFAARLMQLMHDVTGLTEGFMPIPPLLDRTTRNMRKRLDNHLTV